MAEGVGCSPTLKPSSSAPSLLNSTAASAASAALLAPRGADELGWRTLQGASRLRNADPG